MLYKSPFFQHTCALQDILGWGKWGVLLTMAHNNTVITDHYNNPGLKDGSRND